MGHSKLIQQLYCIAIAATASLKQGLTSDGSDDDMMMKLTAGFSQKFVIAAILSQAFSDPKQNTRVVHNVP